MGLTKLSNAVTVGLLLYSDACEVTLLYYFQMFQMLYDSIRVVSSVEALERGVRLKIAIANDNNVDRIL